MIVPAPGNPDVTAQLPPEREPALLEVGEVHRVVDVAHRVAVAETHVEAMLNQNQSDIVVGYPIVIEM